MMVNQKSPLFWLMALLITLLPVGLGCQALAAPYEYKGTVFEPASPLPDFELTDTTGQPFRLSDVEGDIALVYFGYTYCPDVCPLTLADVKKALSALETGQEQVHVIFVSVDPEQDTPEVLSRYLAAYSPDFIGLTDGIEKTEAVMRPFGAFSERQDGVASAAGYLVSHTARLYLVSPQREFLLTYPFGFEPEHLRADLDYLLRQKE